MQQNKIKERHGALMKKMAASPRRAQLEVELKAKRAELDRMTTEYQSKVNVRKKRHSLFSSFFSPLSLPTQNHTFCCFFNCSPLASLSSCYSYAFVAFGSWFSRPGNALTERSLNYSCALEVLQRYAQYGHQLVLSVGLANAVQNTILSAVLFW